VTSRLEGGRFLIQGFDQSRATVAPEDLLICDSEGRKLSGPPDQKPPAEVALHAEIFRARADVNAIAHFHDDLTNVFTVVEGHALVPLKNHAVRWRSGIPVHQDPSHVAGKELGQALARTLGPHHALQIRAHGQVICAEDVRSLLIDSIHFVENAHALYQAAAIGKPIPLTEAEMAAMAVDFHRDRHVAKLWKYYIGQGLDAGVVPEEWVPALG
jgi:ribulose-5-phosphate 4-epimerase/fuculose-1-phosphate aldolase